MRLRISNARPGAMTILEVLVVVVCLVVLAVLLLPEFARAKIHGGPGCVTNLMQIDLAFSSWAEDHNSQFPTTVSAADGGGRQLIEAGNVGGLLQLVSNQMSTTKIFICPDDRGRTFATNWNDLNSSHISYFLGADASNGAAPGIILAGDDNLQINGAHAGSGLLNLSSNSLIEWGAGHHSTSYRPYFWSSPKTRGAGNLIFADGHIGRESSLGLQQAFQRTGLATNRIAIP